MNAYVYSAKLEYEELQQLLQRLAPQVTLSWDLARLDFSPEVRENGVAFNEELEIRWEKEGQQARVLVLCDRALQESLLQPVPEGWTTKSIVNDNGNETEYLADLISTLDRRYAPQFRHYPIVNRENGHLACRVFYRDGVAIFVSPRGIKP